MKILRPPGFLAIGPKGLNESRVKYSKWQVVNDQVDATTRGFIGLTVSCAQCHDHKFDPIPQKDYHALAGIFASTENALWHGGRTRQSPSHFVALVGWCAGTCGAFHGRTDAEYVREYEPKFQLRRARTMLRAVVVAAMVFWRWHNGFRGGTNGFGVRRFAPQYHHEPTRTYPGA